MTINDMITYLEGNASRDEVKNIEFMIKKYPYYKDMLSGLLKLENSLGKFDSVLSYLESKESDVYHRLFNEVNV